MFAIALYERVHFDSGVRTSSIFIARKIEVAKFALLTQDGPFIDHLIVRILETLVV
jgi:hypothetical protein